MTEAPGIRTIMDELDELNRCLHEQEGGSVGGPVHIVTDDGNIRDSDLSYCWRDTENEPNVVVRVVCREILLRLVRLTEPQRLVWWLRERIRGLGLNDVALAESVRDGVVDPQVNGAYDAQIKLGGKVLWVGLEQWEVLSHRDVGA